MLPDARPAAFLLPRHINPPVHETMDPPLLDRCRRISSSTWSDALDQLGLSGVIGRLELRAGRTPVLGPVVTVLEEVGPLGSADPAEFGIDLILAGAAAGDVLLIQQRGTGGASAIGGLAALGAKRHGVAGIVIDGACRDVDELVAIGLPVLSRTTTPASGRGRARIAGVNVPLRFGSDGLEVRPGDLLVADDTGVVVIPARHLEELLQAAEARTARDVAEAERLRAPR